MAEGGHGLGVCLAASAQGLRDRAECLVWVRVRVRTAGGHAWLTVRRAFRTGTTDRTDVTDEGAGPLQGLRACWLAMAQDCSLLCTHAPPRMDALQWSARTCSLRPTRNDAIGA